VREISLLYDLSEFYGLQHRLGDLEQTVKTSGSTPALVLKREMLNDRLETFKEHFKRFKKGYFLNRGFVTFSTHRVALEMKEVFKKAFRERKQGLLDEILMKIHKLDRKTESPARRKFRRIVMQKVIGVLTKKKGDHLSRVSSLLFGTKENPFNTKARLMRDETGDKVG
jgi:hypothetical protein